MKIVSFLPSSFIDYPGKLASVIFTSGCNFRCGFCHNKEIVENKLPLIPEEEILEKLNPKWIYGVVITGGEPTLQNDLDLFIKKIKEKGLKIKLDTNGSNPEMLKELINNKLLDYIAMDIKGSVDNYKKISGYDNIKNIKESISLIKNSKIDYMFRTTLVPSIHDKKELLNLVKLIKGAKTFQLQRFDSDNTLNVKFSKQKSYSEEELLKFKDLIKNEFITVNVV
ncbi:MAG: anaerobic ribonucleoside-triphosphate reductase activating protein [Candidatus Nanoarchaeia archaeon]|nr:anaerobic ribonucleoside-triphosphate reductase activating protein [Candidatus Nanoarchaeia archaeon]